MDIFDGLHPQCADYIDVEKSDSSEDSDMEVTRIVAKAHSLTISAGLILSATCHQQSAKLPSLRISASN